MTATINNTKLTKTQKDEDKIDAETTKLTTATNECKTQAALAQEHRRESNLAFQRADCLISDMCDKMTTRLPQADRDVAAAKSVAIDDVNQCAVTFAVVSAAEQSYHHAKACATRKKNAKQLDLYRRDFDVIVKDLRRTSKHYAKSAEVVIGNQVAQTKVANRGKIRDLKYDHVTYLAEEKKKQ